MESSFSDSIRCSKCGGLNASDAQWCGQCLARLVEAPAPAPKEPVGAQAPEAVRSPWAAGPALQPEAPADPLDRRHAVFTVGEGHVSWTCTRCSTVNAVEANLCSSCGTPFNQMMRSSGPLGGALGGRGFFERIESSLHLIRSSLEVLRSDPELLFYPVIALALFILVGLSFFGGIMAWLVNPLSRGNPSSNSFWIAFLLLGGFYYIAYFIGMMCNAAVIGAAMIRLRGGDPTVGDGLAAAARNALPLAGWAGIAATVGVFLRMIENAAERSGGLFGRIAIGVAGVAWSALTFFVVPVILFESTGPFEGLTRSARLFKERWSETLAGQFGIGLAMGLIALPFAFLVAVGAKAENWPAIIAGGVGFGILAIVGATLSGIFNSALYHFATTGQTLGPFSRGELASAFHRRHV